MTLWLPGLQAAAATSTNLPTLLLSGIVWTPLIGGAALLLTPAALESQRGRLRTGALVATGLTAVFAVFMWYGFAGQGGTLAFEEDHSWLKAIGASYHLGVDGIGMALLLASAVLFFVAVLASHRIREGAKVYFVLLLWMETGLNGAFATRDYLFLIVFWAMPLLPAFLLIGGSWGKEARRVHAAWKFLGFGLVSAGLLLTGVLILVTRAPSLTFDMATLHDISLKEPAATLVFWLFALAAAIPLAAFPLHAWLGDTLAEAPPPIGAVVAGVWTMLGGYGWYRIVLGQFPAQLHHARLIIVAAAVASTAWAAFLSLNEHDLRRLAGWTAMARGGMILLAVGSATPVALNGGVLLMVAGGLASALLLLTAGVVGERAGTHHMGALTGLAERTPRLAVMAGLGALAALGLPGLGTFGGELLVLMGAYPQERVATVLVLVGAVILAAVLLWSVERTFFGPIGEAHQRIRDASAIDLTYGITLVGALALLGIFPSLLTDNITFGVLNLLSKASG